MATYTEYYNLKKPSLDEVVDVGVINENYDNIDDAIYNAQALGLNIGNIYNSIIAYNVGDYCIYNNNLYKCVEATSSGDSFNPAKWQIIKITDDLGGTEVVANPSGSATTTLTKLQVEDTIYNISGGGGGGSTVIVTPTLQSGTKVADIDVDGTTSSLYAPTPTDVEANPSATGTDTLTKLKVGSTTYNVSQGGGSTVSVRQTITSGSEIGGITVNGTETKLYAKNAITQISSSGSGTGDYLYVNLATLDTSGGVSETQPLTVQRSLSGGTKIATLTSGNKSLDLYAPSGGGGGSTTLAGLNDVDLNSSTDGQVLKYDSANQKWVNANEDSGSTVTWNQITQTGTKIATVNIDGTATDVYAPTSGGGGTSSLAGLDDVTIASASNDQDLSYDSTSSKWINKTHRVELTKAQYDALPSSKLTDGIEYFITDMETTGTEIVANPEGSPTDELSSIQIGDEIYSISGGDSAPWKDIIGTLTAGQTSITLTDSSILESSTFDFYTNKFGVNPTDVELVNSTYNFTEFMNGKIVVREHKIDTTDKKLFIVGLTKDSNAISITDTDLLAYLNDITSGYLKGCSSYDTNDSTTQTGILAIGDWGNGLVINTFIVGWTEYKSGTFYGVIDLNEAPVVASGTPQYQQNTYSDPYDVSSGYSLILTFDEQSTDLGVKVRVTNEIN